ncbi:MAG: GTP 3',8-cyclase MoaA [Chromatiales bacterium]|jgi:GTP 3',8-cyclase|nr:GTP 3',8-cyclase MoaA [Chromatiales bacterium]
MNTNLPTDMRGRGLRDLRISVTDRCNFRCVYCMPKSVFGAAYRFLDRKELLTFEEIRRIAAAFVANGVTKLRITGGEPLVRRQIEHLIEGLASLNGVTDLSLTTNGALLTQRRAQQLRDAGLRRITVSLDSLDDNVFKRINDVKFPVARVLEGIDNAAAAGLGPVKINMVVKRGMNDQEVVAMAEQFRGTPHILRFIEYMDVGTTNGWHLDEVMASRDIVAAIDAVHPLEPIDANYHGEVAQRWRYRDGVGELGVISSVSQPFCSDCTRARLSAEGQIYTCLFAHSGHDFRTQVREHNDPERLAQAVAELWRPRDDRYSEIRTFETHRLVDLKPKIEMSYIGG